MDVLVRPSPTLAGPVTYFLSFLTPNTVDRFRQRAANRLRLNIGAGHIETKESPSHVTAKFDNADCPVGYYLFNKVDSMVGKRAIHRVPVTLGGVEYFEHHKFSTIYLAVYGDAIHNAVVHIYDAMESMEWGKRRYPDSILHATIARVASSHTHRALDFVRTMPDLPRGKIMLSRLYLCMYAQGTNHLLMEHIWDLSK